MNWTVNWTVLPKAKAMITETALRISLDTINNYLTEADKASTRADREYWLCQAEAERNWLQRKIKIERFVDSLFGEKHER